MTPDDTPCRLGLWGAFDVEDHGQALYACIVRSELARRLPAASIRIFAPTDLPTRADRGEPAEALGPWSPGREAELAAQLDAVVIGGAGLVDAERFFVEAPAGVAARWHVTDPDEEAALRGAGVEGAIDLTAHPAVLAPRLFPAAVLAKRLEYLRLMGWYPHEGGALVVQGGDEQAPALLRVLDDDPGLALVVTGDHTLADLGRPVFRLPAALSVEDITAAISAAEGFIGPAPWGCMTALAYGTPSVLLRPGPGPDSLTTALAHARKVAPGTDVLNGLQAEVDAWLDRVAAGALAAARSRPAAAGTTRPALESELRAVRLAYRVRVERGNVERVLLADRAARADTELASLRSEVEQLRATAATEAAERARYEAEVAALRRTRTFRWTATARALYRMARG